MTLAAAPPPVPPQSTAQPPPAKPLEVPPPKQAEQQASLSPPPVTAPPAAPAAPPHTGLGFQWPVRGTILVGYGPGSGGTQNDGINIGAAAGAIVVAANDGVVAYAGNELRGFGNLVLVKHADGWTTAYAHCETLLVKRGDRVRRGQPIAKVGQTGAVSEPQLHFEMRRGVQPLDPVGYLPPVSTASTGPGSG
jgi:murein DD-endopeptidase MepM/ murein hydrolase activator NlpD